MAEVDGTAQLVPGCPPRGATHDAHLRADHRVSVGRDVDVPHGARERWMGPARSRRIRSRHPTQGVSTGARRARAGSRPAKGR